MGNYVAHAEFDRYRVLAKVERGTLSESATKGFPL
jgi:hypothetical protein